MFVTAYNFNKVAPEVVQEQVDETVVVEPAEAMTVREMVYRLAMGMPVSGGSLSGEYPDEDQDFDDDLVTEDPSFDLADYAQVSQEISSRYETVTRKKKTSGASKEVPPQANEVDSDVQSSESL